MAEEPKRRLSDRLGMSPTVISESTSIAGDVVTQGPLMVSGHVQGNGRIGGTLSMSKSAHWEGDISARQAVIAGKVDGKIVIEDKLEISSSAVIHGEIVAKILAIANGARIEGAVTVTSGKAIVKFEEKTGRRRRDSTPAPTRPRPRSRYCCTTRCSVPPRCTIYSSPSASWANEAIIRPVAVAELESTVKVGVTSRAMCHRLPLPKSPNT